MAKFDLTLHKSSKNFYKEDSQKLIDLEEIANKKMQKNNMAEESKPDKDNNNNNN